ncbi:uncharacterized protein LOC124205724 isoform X2 [Daphnia pulex]|uniref:uncharacterized protein LOC124205724 isoform X2 n=1 Tax=Daphnia pulex TaxID=6669 RepID=UPI001EDEAC5B|nr:uncharacterized protein LOC124205724 isoform X2 [Daphnia pulex]
MVKFFDVIEMEVHKRKTRGTRKLINYAAIDGNTSSGASDNDFVNNKLVKPTRLTSTKSSKPDRQSKANPVSISADSKVVKVINSFIAEPIVVPHRIWSQETNITSECDCLSLHELSDSSDTDESYPSLPEKLKKIPSLIPTKQVSNLLSSVVELSSKEEKIEIDIYRKRKVTQDAVLTFKQPVIPTTFPVKWKPPGTAFGGGILSNRNSPATGIRLGLSRNHRAKKQLHQQFQNIPDTN